MVAFDRHLYVFGGAADSTLSNDLHCFDLDAQTWSVILPAYESLVPSGRLFHAATVVGDAMFIFGGTIDNNVRSGEMYRFQFATYPKCTLHDDYGKLLETRQFADIQFLVGSGKVKVLAHFALVAARSSYLRSKIRDAKMERDLYLDKMFGTTKVAYADVPLMEVVIEDADPEAFEMVLNYIYMDLIDPTKKANEGEDVYSSRIVLLMMNVYRLAVKFKMTRLEQLCVQYLNATICLKNVLEALHNAVTLGLDFIKEFCLRFIVKETNYNQIVMSKEFEDLDRALMVEIIRRKQMPLTKFHFDTTAITLGASLQQDMAIFLRCTGQEFSDIDLNLEGHIVPAHKSILAARCSYFEAMFRSFMPEDCTVRVSRAYSD